MPSVVTTPCQWMEDSLCYHVAPYERMLIVNESHNVKLNSAKLNLIESDLLWIWIKYNGIKFTWFEINLTAKVQNRDGLWICINWRHWGSSVVRLPHEAVCLLCLMFVTRHPDSQAIERGIQLLIDKQLPNGDWPQVSLCPPVLKAFLYLSFLQSHNGEQEWTDVNAVDCPHLLVHISSLSISQISDCTVLYCTPLQSALLQCTVLCCIIQDLKRLCYTILHNCINYFSLLCVTVLYCHMIDYPILHYVILLLHQQIIY